MSHEAAMIVGGGQTGAYAAMSLREAGFGGRIVVIGEEAHAPYDRPPLSKAMLTQEPMPAPAPFHAPAKLDERGIELRLATRVVEIDRSAARLRLADGATVPYDRLLLATGGTARHLAVPGGERALTVRTLEDAMAIRARLGQGVRVVCVGAGVIGLEVAASARARGAEVTVLEAGAACMGRSLTPAFAQWLGALHEGAGVRLRFGVTVREITGEGVVCADGVVPADVVIVGIGITRNTELAVAAGLAVEGGIVVDEFCRTEDPAIFAAGDVAAFWHPFYGSRLRLEAWRHAMNHGIAAGRAMAGRREAYADLPWFWTDQHGVNLQVAGLPERAASSVLRGAMGGASFAVFHLDAEGCVVGATGVNAAREIRAAQALIGLRRPADAAALADPSRNLQGVVAAMRLG